MQQHKHIHQNCIYSSFEAINKAESEKLLRARAHAHARARAKATTTTATANKVTSPLIWTHTPSNTITLDSSWPSEVSQHMLSVWPPMATSSCSSIKYGVVDDNISDTTLSFIKSSSCWFDCGLCNGVVNNNSLMMAIVGFSDGSGCHFRSRSGGACDGGSGGGVVDDISYIIS
uniref:Uncharacterized protein n=1 Tax=Glossina pallidipes TaxID=7398 RepID=A0A1A9ZKJ9_GLOPL